MLITATVIFLLTTVSAAEVVQTTTGPIQGVTAPSGDVDVFLGIPYAEPPVGDLRFAKPVSKKPWAETLDASHLPPPCVQMPLEFKYYFAPDITSMTEDCLYLNIWTPKTSELKPIIFVIYSGAFFSGASNMKEYDGTNFARRGNVVVVTMNYRLGAFGYFMANIDEAPGNMGMYDQLMALKWLKDNAIHFGGDPENIVLLGVSAGAMSVGAHLVSPVSKDLFHKAILQSGGIVHNLFGSNNGKVFKNSKEIARSFGCSDKTATLETDPRSVVDCLKQKPATSFAKEERKIHESSPLMLFPRINDEFLPQSSVEMFREGKFKTDVPILTGFNENEGTVLLIFRYPEYFGGDGKTISLNVNERRASTIIQGLAMMLNESNPTELVQHYKKFLKGTSQEDYIKMLADLSGDYLVSCSTIFQADFLSIKGNPVYFYKFGFRAASTPMADWAGVSHLDEIQYVFRNPYHEKFTNEEIELSNRMMDRWSAFARTGNPNTPGQQEWPQYSYENPSYLNIGQDGESVKTHPSDRCDMWRRRFQAEIN